MKRTGNASCAPRREAVTSVRIMSESPWRATATRTLAHEPPGHREAYNTSMATASYLDRLLEPLTEAFTPRMASVLLELRADSELEAHIDALRRKANSGTLTPEEEVEYKEFVEAVDLISIMQAKARRTKTGLAPRNSGRRQ